MQHDADEVTLNLNPRYIISGFRTQARNISKTYDLNGRKMACLMAVVSGHILKHGTTCFASTDRLLRLYNEQSSAFNVRSISERTLKNYLSQCEQSRLIVRERESVPSLGIVKRHISINLQELAKQFSGVFNYAISCVQKYLNRGKSHAGRQKMHSGRSTVSNDSEASNHKGLAPDEKIETCPIRSKDLSKESKNINIKEPITGEFYTKFFGEDAKEAQSLQQAARENLITAAGAKKLIKIHAKHGYELAQSFKRYLHYKIGEQWVSTSKKTQPSMKARSVEYFRDRFGRVQVRFG